jgi:sn-glycerol 3-phosphate transport system permease protein
MTDRRDGGARARRWTAPTTPGAAQIVGIAFLCAIAFVWATPFLWMLVAAFRPDAAADPDIASLLPPAHPTLANFAAAFASADFLTYAINTTIVVLGILAVQIVTMSLAGYAFARLTFPGKNLLFTLFLLQLMLVPPILIVPNLTTIVRLGMYDSLLGVMAPYCASAFGTFLMQQTFKTIPRDFEEAAVIDGARLWQLLRYVLLPLAKPGIIAFSIISVSTHWNEFLWPLMVTNSPERRTLTVGLASFTSGAEGGHEWGLIAAGTLIVALPLMIAFLAFQRQFVNSFMFSGVKG